LVDSSETLRNVIGSDENIDFFLAKINEPGWPVFKWSAAREPSLAEPSESDTSSLMIPVLLKQPSLPIRYTARQRKQAVAKRLVTVSTVRPTPVSERVSDTTSPRVDQTQA
jgi:hypothetical protein